MTTPRFGVELASLAGQLSLAQVRAWCAVLDRAEGPDETVEAALIHAHTGSGPAGTAATLVGLWRRYGSTMPGAAVSLGLSAAAHVHEEADHRRPRLVVSGPATPSVPVRLTSSVVVDLIREATDRVLLVSFAAYGVSRVVSALSASADRGVTVDLVLETTEEHGGRLRSGAGSGAFVELAGRVAFWHWPGPHRVGTRGALHAKVLVADGTTALLTSANFTDRGLDDNIEVGVLLRDPDQVGALDAHFRALMRPEARCLVRLPD